MESVLDAARELFAASGPDNVSMRSIANKARVNHALIHRHFGTKDELIKAVLHREAVGFSESLANVATSSEAAGALFAENLRRREFVRILAYSLLSDLDMEPWYSDAGAMAPLIDRARRDLDATPEDTAPIIAAAALSAFTKGWVLFEPWVLRAVGRATGSQLDPVDVRRHVSVLLEGLFNPTPDDR